jgi:hypothetical protein
MAMTEALGVPAEEVAQVPADENTELIVIRRLDRLEATHVTNPSGA